jgi:hypothetical protein
MGEFVFSSEKVELVLSIYVPQKVSNPSKMLAVAAQMSALEATTATALGCCRGTY